MSALPGVSILVNNYNQGSYVGAAIESALAQDHPECEVIVVDDASTDGSQAVIERYAGRVRTVLREQNGHQLAALRSAWPLARHPILMFLDADDALLPHAASAVAQAWQPGTAKVQFLLASMDADGRPLGHVAPKYPPQLETAAIRAELLRTGSAPSPPGSGNAYARWLLDRVDDDGGFVPPPDGVVFIDTMLEINAPFYGSVVTLREPLARYRMHEGNWSQQGVAGPARFRLMTDLLDRKLVYLAARCRSWNIPFDPAAVAGRNLWYVENRMADARFEERNGARRALGLLAPSLRACMASPFSPRQKLTRAAWLSLVAVSPRTVAMRLIEARFVVKRRPRWIERLVGIGRRRAGAAPAAADAASMSEGQSLRV